MKLRNKPASAAAQMVRHSQQGFTLIEIAIVLTIVGLIIGGIWIAASTVFANNKAQQFAKQVIQVMQNTKTLFASQGASANTTGFSLANAYAANIFPPDMAVSSSTIVNPWSGATNSVGVVDPTATTTLEYIFAGLPGQACSQVALALYNNTTALGITALKAGAGTAGTTVGALTTGTTVNSPSTAATGCSAAGNGNAIDVTFSVI